MTANLVKAAAIATVATSLFVASCGGDTEAAPGPETGPDRAMRALFQGDFTPPPPVTTLAMVELGRDLYHDQRLSKNQNLSCASCHDLDLYGQDGQPTSPGSDGERGGRNSPTSVNAFRQFAQFWDGRAADVEEQAQGPVVNPIEHGFSTPEEFVAALKGIDGLSERFAEVFPGEDDPVTLANFGRAVGAFERTLVTKGRWEAYLGGDDSALTAAEKAGLKTFLDVGCSSCHVGQTVGGGTFQKLGLLVPYETEDIGRAQATGNDVDRYFFKVPMLLNVAETAPYFHDGSVKTLEEAVRLMGKHQRGMDLTEEQIGSIVTFLKALTGEPQWKPM